MRRIILALSFFPPFAFWAGLLGLLRNRRTGIQENVTAIDAKINPLCLIVTLFVTLPEARMSRSAAEERRIRGLKKCQRDKEKEREERAAAW